MGWPDAITEGLPPPHEGEPSRLRQDIIDELADHLAMAMQRELRRNEDESVARRAVLDRFGDPLAVARRLWWDAMKEKIMKDRLMLIGVAVVLVAVLAFLGVSWAAQSRINQAILAKLEGLSARPSAPAVPENWAKAVVRVVEGAKGGPPVAGVELSLNGKPFTDSEQSTLNAETDAEGRASFGPVRPGEYQLTARNLKLGLSREPQVALYPGQVFEQVLVCPPKSAQGQVSFQLSELPRWLEPGSLIACSLAGAEPVVADGTYWRAPAPAIWLNVAGEILQGIQSSRYTPRQEPGARSTPTSMHYLASQDSVTTVPSVTWVAAKYRLQQLNIYRPVPCPDPEKRTERCWRQVGPSLESGPTFEVKMGQANTWNIELPKEWLEKVHDAVPVDVAFRFQNAPEWLGPDWIIQVEVEEGSSGAAKPRFPLELKPTGQRVLGLDRQSPPGGTSLLYSRSAPETEPAMVLRPKMYRLAALGVYRTVPSPNPQRPQDLYWSRVGPAHAFPPDRQPEFKPEVGKSNVWTIELPADWLEKVRAAGGSETRRADHTGTTLPARR